MERIGSALQPLPPQFFRCFPQQHLAIGLIGAGPSDIVIAFGHQQGHTQLVRFEKVPTCAAVPRRKLLVAANPFDQIADVQGKRRLRLGGRQALFRRLQ